MKKKYYSWPTRTTTANSKQWTSPLQRKGYGACCCPQWKLPYSRLLSGYDGRVYRHAGISRRQQDLIDLYKINPNDYPILVQEQKSPTATE
ncbi:hypothetical protein PDM24_03395 [Bacteroides fragilis]|uniref:hypothetical protein n=1 Tax=Bacteroides TaxID=816 RepID=UPI0018DEE9E9|nr:MULTISPECIES: hypothetical protein [Bacteroides]MCE8631323.1 hypothetical protein [Bacteroides fragilis]MCE8679784.1 hypothetical protein [Bacteroides fragilis]MCE8684195.1 hypothetical protein [Bacteroides fragilis]MCM0221722.1 hypothetical protein [Bacteroides fragilis]MCM0297248.1 hypothetical protein [Bacteroides fragilis]